MDIHSPFGAQKEHEEERHTALLSGTNLCAIQDSKNKPGIATTGQYRTGHKISTHFHVCLHRTRGSRNGSRYYELTRVLNSCNRARDHRAVSSAHFHLAVAHRTRGRLGRIGRVRHPGCIHCKFVIIGQGVDVDCMQSWASAGRTERIPPRSRWSRKYNTRARVTQTYLRPFPDAIR